MNKTKLLPLFLGAAVFYMTACRNEQTDTTTADTTVILVPTPAPESGISPVDSAPRPKDSITKTPKAGMPADKIKIVLDNKKETETEVRMKKVSKKGRIILQLLKMNPQDKIEADTEGVYARAEIMPAYPGGENALRDFVENHIQYPDKAIDNNISGTVRVYFIVDEQGKIAAPTIIPPKLGYGLEEEALRVIKQMPNWIPGQVQGTRVSTRITLPITYKID